VTSTDLSRRKNNDLSSLASTHTRGALRSTFHGVRQRRRMPDALASNERPVRLTAVGAQYTRNLATGIVHVV
jgi:hypothetical protein